MNPGCRFTHNSMIPATAKAGNALLVISPEFSKKKSKENRAEKVRPRTVLAAIDPPQAAPARCSHV